MTFTLLRSRLPTTFARVQPRLVMPIVKQYTSFSSRHENDPQKLDEMKQHAKRAQETGQGKWNEDGASDAEAFIKATRDEIEGTDSEIQKLDKQAATTLQEQAEQAMNEKNPGDA